MDRAEELRQFLRSRRARLTPPDVGLPWRVEGRRVRGLRREELALAAGISVDYYSKLEQGRAQNASDQVLSALAAALQLTEVERQHLWALCRPTKGVGGAPRLVRPTPAVRGMVDALDPTPALVHNSMLDVLAINRAGTILFGSLTELPRRRRNLARWTFRDPRARDALPSWEMVARSMVATLRSAASQHPDAGELKALVGELCMASEEFAHWWTDHDINPPGHFLKHFRHDLVGTLALHYQSLQIPQEPDHFLAVYTADPGSPAAEKLATLTTPSGTATSRERGQTTPRSSPSTGAPTDVDRSTDQH